MTEEVNQEAVCKRRIKRSFSTIIVDQVYKHAKNVNPADLDPIVKELQMVLGDLDKAIKAVKKNKVQLKARTKKLDTYTLDELEAAILRKKNQKA